jgi:hypothetical protein
MRSCSCIQFRGVARWQPILSAIKRTAAHWEPWAWDCFCTIRRALSRTSGEDRDGLGVVPTSPEMYPPTIQGGLVAFCADWVRVFAPQGDHLPLPAVRHGVTA